jgi:hypothetical protein
VRPERAADHLPPSSAKGKEQNYTSTPLWATTGPVTGLLLHTYKYVQTEALEDSAGVCISILDNTIIQFNFNDSPLSSYTVLYLLVQTFRGTFAASIFRVDEFCLCCWFCKLYIILKFVIIQKTLI